LKEDPGRVEEGQTFEIFRAAGKILLADHLHKCQHIDVSLCPWALRLETERIRLNITFEQQNSSAESNVVSAEFVKDITDKFAALERAIQSTTASVLNTFMEILTKVNGLPDAFGRRIESRFAELPVISETARKTFLVVQSSFQDTPSLSDQLSIEVRRVVRDTVQRAIFEATDKQVTVSDIEAIMRRVLLERDLHISRNGSSISGEEVLQSESLPQLGQSQRGIRRRKRFFPHRQDRAMDDGEPSLTSHNQDTERDTKKTSRVLSLLIQIFPHLDSRNFYLAFEIVRNSTIFTAMMRSLHAKLLAILAACYSAFCMQLAALANGDYQVIMPKQQLYVNIVFLSGQNQIELFCLDVTNLQNDTQLLLSLNKFYEEKLYSKCSWKKYLAPRAVIEMRFVEFEIHHPSGAVSVRRTDTLPPSTHSAYRYRLPPESGPPPNSCFMHVFVHSAFLKNGNRKIWLDGIPKCTSLGLQLDQMNRSEQIGWGLEIVEVRSRKQIIDFLYHYISTSAVSIGLLATLYNYELRGSRLWRWWCVMMFLSSVWSELAQWRVLRFRRHQKVFEYDLISWRTIMSPMKS
jgi:hypothetical protein